MRLLPLHPFGRAASGQTAAVELCLVHPLNCAQQQLLLLESRAHSAALHCAWLVADPQRPLQH